MTDKTTLFKQLTIANHERPNLCKSLQEYLRSLDENNIPVVTPVADTAATVATQAAATAVTPTTTYTSEKDRKYNVSNLFEITYLVKHEERELGKSADDSVYLFLLVKFINLLDSVIDTNTLTDSQIMSAIRMVKVVYDIQYGKSFILTVGNRKMPNINKLNHFDYTEYGETYIPKETRYHNCISNFVNGCSEMFLTVILTYKK